ncbi:MAG: DUF448 domain-containing protein [Pseudomonadota bacterium]
MRTPTNERVSSDIADAGGQAGKGRSVASGSQEGCAASGHRGGGGKKKNRKNKRNDKAAPERRCILTSDNAPQDKLLRLAISPPDAGGMCDILPDPSAKAPGRGAWISLDRAALEAAMANGQLKGALARGFKGEKLSYSDDLPQQIENALRQSLMDRLGLELRAGQLVMGSGRIEDQARAGSLHMLLHASDSSEDGRKKLDQAWRVGREAEGSGERGSVLPLDRAALSVALGRENVVHLALRGAGGADRMNRALSRLMAFSGADLTGCEGSTEQSTGAANPPRGDDIEEYTKD